jgi:hypothetical protein
MSTCLRSIVLLKAYKLSGVVSCSEMNNEHIRLEIYCLLGHCALQSHRNWRKFPRWLLHPSLASSPWWRRPSEPLTYNQTARWKTRKTAIFIFVADKISDLTQKLRNILVRIANIPTEMWKKISWIWSRGTNRCSWKYGAWEDSELCLSPRL